MENRREAKVTAVQITGVILKAWKGCLRPKAKRHYGQEHAEGKAADAKKSEKNTRTVSEPKQKSMMII